MLNTLTSTIDKLQNANASKDIIDSYQDIINEVKEATTNEEVALAVQKFDELTDNIVNR